MRRERSDRSRVGGHNLSQAREPTSKQDNAQGAWFIWCAERNGGHRVWQAGSVLHGRTGHALTRAPVQNATEKAASTSCPKRAPQAPKNHAPVAIAERAQRAEHRTQAREPQTQAGGQDAERAQRAERGVRME